MSAVGSAAHDDNADPIEDSGSEMSRQGDQYLHEILRMADKAEDLLERFKYRYPEIQDRFERLRSSKTPEEENADDILDRFKRRYPELRGSPGLSNVITSGSGRKGKKRSMKRSDAGSAPSATASPSPNRIRSDSMGSSNLNMAGALLAKYSASVEDGSESESTSVASSVKSTQSQKSSGTGTTRMKRLKSKSSRSGKSRQTPGRSSKRSTSQSRSRPRRRSTSDISELLRMARSSSVPARPKKTRSKRSRKSGKSGSASDKEASRISEQTELYNLRMKRLKSKYKEIVEDTQNERDQLNSSQMFEEAKQKFEMQRAARELAKAEAGREKRKRSQRKKSRKGKRRGNFDVVAKPLKIGGSGGYMQHFDRKRWARNQKKTQCILEDLRCTYPEIARTLQRNAREECPEERCSEPTPAPRPKKRSKRPPPPSDAGSLKSAEDAYYRAKYEAKKVKRRAIEEPSFMHANEFAEDYSAEKAKGLLAIQRRLVKMRNQYPQCRKSTAMTDAGSRKAASEASEKRPKTSKSSKKAKSKKSARKSATKKPRSLPAPSDNNYTVTGFEVEDLKNRYMGKRFVSVMTSTSRATGESESSQPSPMTQATAVGTPIPPIPEAPATQTPGQGPITQTPGGPDLATAYRTPGGPGDGSEAGGDGRSDWSMSKLPINVLKQLYFEKPTPAGPGMFGGTSTDVDGMTAMTGWTKGAPADSYAPSQTNTQAQTAATTAVQSEDLREIQGPVTTKSETNRLYAMDLDQIKAQYFSKPEVWNDSWTAAGTRTNGDLASTAPPKSQRGDRITALTPGGPMGGSPASPTSAAPTTQWPYADVFDAQRDQPARNQRSRLTQDMAPVEEVKGGRKHGFTSLIEQDNAYPTPPLKASQPPCVLQEQRLASYPPRRTVASISEFSYQPQIASVRSSNIPKPPPQFQRIKYTLPPMTEQASSAHMPPVPFKSFAGQSNVTKIQSSLQYKSGSTRKSTPPQASRIGTNTQISPSTAGSQWRSLGGYGRIVSTPPPTVPPMPLISQNIARKDPGPAQPYQFPLSDRTEQYRNQATEASSSVSSRMRPKSGLSSNGSGPLFVRKARPQESGYQESGMTLGRVAEAMNRDYLETYSETTDATSNAQVIETEV